MLIVCPTCNKRLQIADEKLPTDRQVRLTCPSCQGKFTFDPYAKEAYSEATAVFQSATTSSVPSASRTVPLTHHAAPVTVDITDVGTAPRALVCLEGAAHSDMCQDILPSLGYQTVHTPSNQAQALAYLSQVPYECFILDVMFDGSSLEANPVLACLHELPMDQRRYTFVVLCLPDAVTADAMVAYSHGVSLVMDYHDVPSCRRIMEQGLIEHKRMYKVYRELRQHLGKDI